LPLELRRSKSVPAVPRVLLARTFKLAYREDSPENRTFAR
jgi:hypothetical protein